MQNNTKFTVLLSKGIEVAPRIIGHLDRNPLSPTFGYFGRRYWAWKMAAMPDASNQYALYYLAVLWSLNEPENPFYHDEKLLEWISAGIMKWMTIQNKDGSFDQVFPNEHSVGATSYTLLAVLETNRILGDNLDPTLKKRMFASINRAGIFLLSNDETYGIISNHLALFAVTFQELWKLTGEREYKDKCERQIIAILDHMSQEGWFKEYEGADPGYTTQCLYYLARLQHEGYDELTLPIEAAVRRFLPYCIHPDGSLGGHYGSRNTSIIYPAGLSLLYSMYPEARVMLSTLCEGIRKGNSPCPDSLDFPNALRLAVNYLIAWEHLKGIDKDIPSVNSYRLPCEEDKVWKEFPDAGIVTVGTATYYAILGVKKGGTLKVFDKSSHALAIDDRGYAGQWGRQSITTQVYNHTSFEKEGNTIKFIHPLFFANLRSMSPWKYCLILFLGISVFRWNIVRETFKKVLVKYLITGKRPTTGKYSREVTFDDNIIIIKDKLFMPPNRKKISLKKGVNHSAIHMASADYFDFSMMRCDVSSPDSISDTEDNEILHTIAFPFKGKPTEKQPKIKGNDK